jgi:hypothetical protein
MRYRVAGRSRTRTSPYPSPTSAAPHPPGFRESKCFESGYSPWLLDRGFEFFRSSDPSIPSRRDQARVDIRFREEFEARRIPRSPVGDVSDVESSAEDGSGEEAVGGPKEWTTPLAAFSNPAPDSFFVSNIVCAKPSFKVVLLSINYTALHHSQHDEQQSQRPE